MLLSRQLWVTCFFGLGVFMLNTLRTVIDRRANCVTVRSGLLGWKRTRRPLSEFRWITVIERAPRFVNADKHEWEIVLLGESVEPLTIGIATIDFDLATTFLHEVSQFTGLKQTTAATSSNFAAKSVVIDPL